MKESSANQILEEYLNDLLCETVEDDPTHCDDTREPCEINAAASKKPKAKDSSATTIYEAVSHNPASDQSPPQSLSNTAEGAEIKTANAIKVERPHKIAKAPSSTIETTSDKTSSPNQSLRHATASHVDLKKTGSPIDRALLPRPSSEALPALQSTKPAEHAVSQGVETVNYNPRQETILEEAKRQQLQEMLTRRTGENLRAKVETKRKVDIDPAKTASETPAQSDLTTQPETDSEKEIDPLMAWGENGRPLWAEGSFEVLLFEVCGLSLAVPLVSLGQIIPMSEKLTVLQGQSEWFMGILPSHVGDIRCVNTALFVMPERYNDKFVQSAKYVVTIDGMPWGLAVDSVKQPITLSPDDVKWRSQRSQRPWLAGTVKSHMCALVDIPQMGELLQRADKNYSASNS